LAADERFAAPAARLAHRDALDAIVSAWTREREPAAAAEALQAGGVAAAPVYSPADLAADAHLGARGYFVDLDREFVGRHPHPGLPFRFSATPAEVRRASPTLGQDNRQVLGGILGLSDAELAALEAERVIGTRPL
ncbi:MAG: CoA transferase, partial [Chloroflexi bacterium]|nr:CoA transferase [Chloroflexota bacterium]